MIDERKCETCESTERLEKHHIKRQHKFKKGEVRNYPNNIMILCYWCHMREHHPDWVWDEKIVSIRTWVGRYYWLCICGRRLTPFWTYQLPQTMQGILRLPNSRCLY